MKRTGERSVNTIYMDSQTNQTSKEEVVEARQQTKQFTHEELMTAMYVLWDMFGRAGIDFFLIRDTAKQVQENRKLTGDHIDIGVRKPEWVTGNRQVIDEAMKDYLVKVNAESAEYKIGEVPIFLTTFSDNDCISSLDVVMYDLENFNLPQRLKEFNEKYDHA